MEGWDGFESIELYKDTNKVIRIFKSNFFNVNIDPLFLCLVPVMLLARCIPEYLITFTAILLHELGHIVSTLLLGGRVHSLNILPVGLNAAIGEGACGSRSRLAIYFSGPFVNILLFSACLAINSYYPAQSDGMRFFIWINIYLAIFNMMPVLPLDGGKILREILAAQMGLLLASKYIRKISLWLSVLLITVGITLLFTNARNFTLFIIGLYIFFSLKSEQAEAALMNVKHIVYRRTRLLKRGIYPARDLVVVKSMRLSETIKNLDFDRFHIIHVLDENLKLVKMLTEHELMEGMLKYNGEITFEELIKAEKDTI